MPTRKINTKLYSAKKYKGIYELYRKSDNSVSGYYYSFQDEAGKVLKVRATITEKPGTKKAVDEVATQKAQAVLDRDKKLKIIEHSGHAKASTFDMTVNDLMEEFFVYQEKPHTKRGKTVAGRSAQAIKKDRSAYERLALPFVGDLKISHISKRHIEDIQKDMINREYKDATIANLLIVLQSAFNYADDKNYNTTRPLKKVSVRKPKPEEDIRLLSMAEVKQIFIKAEEIHKDLFFHTQVLFYTAQRPSSIMALTRGDIDLNNREISIRPIKGQKARKFPIPDALMPVLEKQIDGLEPADTLTGIGEKYMAKLSTKLFDAMNEDQYMTKALKERNDLLEIKNARSKAFKEQRSKWISRYSFRHTSATMLYNREKDIYLVQKALNHSTPTMTQRYAQMDSERLRGALNGLGEV